MRISDWSSDVCSSDLFVRLPGETIRFIPIEQVILLFVDRLFPNYRVKGQGVFRVIRDSEMEIDEEAEDLVLSFETALKARRRGNVIRLSVDLSMPDPLQHLVVDELKVARGEVFTVEQMVGMAARSQRSEEHTSEPSHYCASRMPSSA